MFGDKKKQKEPAAAGAAAANSNTNASSNANGNNSAFDAQAAAGQAVNGMPPPYPVDRMMHGGMSAGAALGLTNDPDQYMLNAGVERAPGQKKRMHRGFQQLLKKEQLSYIPPSLPLYQHSVRCSSSSQPAWTHQLTYRCCFALFIRWE